MRSPNILQRPHFLLKAGQLASVDLKSSRSKPGAGIDLRICRSDYETGRWEALKPKPAQMESDACSANCHQPTAGCLKAFDL